MVVLKELILRKFSFIPFNSLQSLIRRQIECDQLEDALSVFGSIRSRHMKFNIHEVNSVPLVLFCIKQKNFSDAADILLSTIKTIKVDFDRDLTYGKIVAAIVGQIPSEKYENILNHLREHRIFFDFVNSQKNDIYNKIRNHQTDEAVEKFCEVCKKYKITPCQQLLIQHLIKVKDIENMKRVTNAMCEVRDHIYVLYDTAIAFIESGYVSYGVDLMKQTESNDKITILWRRCVDYNYKAKRFDVVENLFHASIELFPNAEIQFVADKYLLSLCRNEESAEKISNVSKLIAEKNIVPSENTLKVVHYHFAMRAIEIPSKWLKSGSQLSTSNKKWEQSDEELRKLIEENQLDRAKTIVFDALDNQEKQFDRQILRFFLKKSSDGGFVDVFNELREKLDLETLKILDFSRYEMEAYIVADKPKQYIDIWLNAIKPNSTISSKTLSVLFPNKFTKLLHKHPMLCTKCKSTKLIHFLFLSIYYNFIFSLLDEELAKEYFNLRIQKPILLLYLFHFENDNQIDCQRIRENYKFDDNVLCKLAIREFLLKPEKLKAIIESMNKPNLDRTILGRAYSVLIIYLIDHDQQGQAILELQNISKYVGTSFLSPNALRKFKFGTNDMKNALQQIINKEKKK